MKHIDYDEIEHLYGIGKLIIQGLKLFTEQLFLQSVCRWKNRKKCVSVCNTDRETIATRYNGKQDLSSLF